MKKLISSALIAGTLIVSPVQKAHSSVGLDLVYGGMILTGLITTGVGGFGYFLAEEGLNGKPRTFWSNFFGALTIGGLIILDDDSANYQFSELANDKADEIGISKDDLAIYNAEVHELNLVKDQVKFDFLNAKDKDLKTSQALWDNYKDLLSPATIETAEKIIATQLKK